MYKKLKFFIFSSLIIYVLLNSIVFYQSYHYEQELNKLDIDQDDFFRKSEITPEIRAAMDKLTNDTARSLAPFTLIPVSLLLGGVLLLCFKKKL